MTELKRNIRSFINYHIELTACREAACKDYLYEQFIDEYESENLTRRRFLYNLTNILQDEYGYEGRYNIINYNQQIRKQKNNQFYPRILYMK